MLLLVLVTNCTSDKHHLLANVRAAQFNSMMLIRSERAERETRSIEKYVDWTWYLDAKSHLQIFIDTHGMRSSQIEGMTWIKSFAIWSFFPQIEAFSGLLNQGGG